MRLKATDSVSYYQKYALSFFYLVDDQVVIDLVAKEIETAEADKMSWIIQGFPRTKV